MIMSHEALARARAVAELQRQIEHDVRKRARMTTALTTPPSYVQTACALSWRTLRDFAALLVGLVVRSARGSWSQRANDVDDDDKKNTNADWVDDFARAENALDV